MFKDVQWINRNDSWCNNRRCHMEGFAKSRLSHLNLSMYAATAWHGTRSLPPFAPIAKRSWLLTTAYLDVYRNELANWTGLRQKHHLLDFKLTRGTTFWIFLAFQLSDLSQRPVPVARSYRPWVPIFPYPGHCRSHQKSAGTSRGAISHPDPCAEM